MFQFLMRPSTSKKEYSNHTSETECKRVGRIHMVYKLSYTPMTFVDMLSNARDYTYMYVLNHVSNMQLHLCCTYLMTLSGSIG